MSLPSFYQCCCDAALCRLHMHGNLGKENTLELLWLLVSQYNAVLRLQHITAFKRMPQTTMELLLLLRR
jgi:hypothetical protein